MMLIMSKKTSVIFSFIFLFIFSLHYLPFLSSASQQLAPALYVFGDSLLDSGNNNHLPTIVKANYWPYGFNFPKRATGRFNNGRSFADFTAEYLGLPHPPPYLSTRNNIPLTGLNYASGACGILPKTGSAFGKCLTFDEQVGLFGETVKLLRQKYFKQGSEKELSNYLSKSIFLISVGNNDYLLNYLPNSLSNGNKYYSPQRFGQLLAHALSHQLERLYNFGARKIMVGEVGAIGCMPAITWKYHQHVNREFCDEDMNQLVSHFNKLLPPMFKNLTSSLKGSTFVIGHIQSFTHDIVDNPSKYGFEDVSKPCCATLLNGLSGCIPSKQIICHDPDKNVFWDGFHPTEHVHSLLSSFCINDTSLSTPITLSQLVKI